MANKDD